MKKIAILLLFSIGLFHISNAQVLSVTPIFPTVEDTVTIIYDATQGNGALVGVSPVYAHTGVITTSSTAPNDWKYVQGNWGTADLNVEMTDLGGNLHEIKYHIRSYYGIPQTDTVLQMAFVFRDSTGNTVGRAADGSDIFYDVQTSGSLIAAFITPSAQSLALNNGETIEIFGGASASATMTLYDNGVQLKQIVGQELYDTRRQG